MDFLKRIWNFEINQGDKFWASTKWIFPFVWIVGIGFAFHTVMIIGVLPGADNLTIHNFSELFEKYFKLRQNDALWVRPYLPYVWLVVAAVAIISRAAIIISSYYLSKKRLGEDKFNQLFSTYLMTFFIGTATLLLFTCISVVSYLSGSGADWMKNLIHTGMEGFRSLLEMMIPFSIGIKSYWLAIILSIFIASLPGYIVHYLSHRSRFLWLTAHKAHHCPEFLFPIAAPANNIPFLETLLAIPGLIFFTVISGMIYTEPLIFELAIWFTLRLWLESFNHSYIHYDFAKHPVIKKISMMFGDIGVYHLVHHSAYERDQNVNFGASPFMFWDRVFGTFREPYNEAPPIGLTDQPPISLSPMKIVFSGFAQLAYEWKMNKDWRVRFKIIFGDVYYKPPVTKDFLLQLNG